MVNILSSRINKPAVETVHICLYVLYDSELHKLMSRLFTKFFLEND